MLLVLAVGVLRYAAAKQIQAVAAVHILCLLRLLKAEAALGLIVVDKLVVLTLETAAVMAVLAQKAAAALEDTLELAEEEQLAAVVRQLLEREVAVVAGTTLAG